MQIKCFDCVCVVFFFTELELLSLQTTGWWWIYKLVYFIFCCSAPNTPGRTGSIQQSYIQFGTLDAASLQNFPLELIKIMRRNAEDLLLSNNHDHKATDTLRFILSLRKGRSDVQKIKKGKFVRELKL